METGIITAIIAACAAIIGGVISGIFGLILQHVKHSDEREDKIEDQRTKWEKLMDKRVTSLEKRMADIEEANKNSKDIRKLMLKGLMLLNRHAVDNDHNADLEAYADEVNNILIEKM